MTSISWLHDFKLWQYHGGAELSDYYWMEALREAGYQVNEYTHSVQVPLGAPLIIGNFGRTGIKQKITQPYIVIVHGEKLPEPYPGFYDNAVSVIGMSPAHAKRVGASQYFPPYIPQEFCASSREPQRDAIYIGRISNYKGIPETIEYCINNNIEIDFFGTCENDGSRELVLDSGYKLFSARSTMRVLPNYKRLVWRLPRKGSYGRTVVEAFLMGLDADVNRGNFELFSYDWDFGNPLSIREEIDIARHEFVRNIELLLK